ncbi:protein phosphatase 2C domain-containing protein [Nocardia sp. NPDC050697]|uniref:protein phosphatase 2C domain-containing protein n=1 Tax=Nocardia sp. NPDC050697 TaxID=3155158 RepID=UPI0033EDFB73
MDIAVSVLPARTDEDRALIFDDGVVVLDGATSHGPDVPPASEYVDRLGAAVIARLNRHSDPASALAEAISATAHALHLRPGISPSSTVAVVQLAGDRVRVLVLGDTTVVTGRADGTHEVQTDDRLNELAIPQADEYRRRLASGTGYDEQHRELLGELQRAQRVCRNRDDGYWIAEADPAAARHARIVDYPRDALTWVIIATDGARDTIEALGIPWPEVAERSQADLDALLAQCHAWEADSDPDGRQLPRAKQHDDKTLAVVHL